MIAKPNPSLCLRSLASTTCPACGGPKQRRKTFCGRDYFKLPQPMRKALYAKFGAGYEPAMQEAMNFLGAELFHPPAGGAP